MIISMRHILAQVARLAVLLIFTAIVDATFTAQAAEPGPAETHVALSRPTSADRASALSRRGVALYHNDQFGEALIAFQQLIALDPTLPEGYVLTAAVYHSMMQDYRTRRFARQFEKAVTTGIKRAETRIEGGLGVARAYQYMGAAYGFKGLYSVLQGAWFTAFRDGSRMRSALENALELNPDIADADYGLGFYMYWRTVKASVFKWLLFIGDEREAGIRKLRRAAIKGEVCRGLAQIGLIRIAVNEKHYAEAQRLAAAFQKQYPANILTWWLRGQAAVAQRDWDAVRQTHQEVLDRLRRKPFSSREAVLEARYHIAIADLKQGYVHRARAILHEIVAAEDRVDDDLWEDLDIVEAAEDLLDDL